MWFLRMLWVVLKTECTSSARPDPKHGSRRRLCKAYLKRRQQVKNFWIIAGLIVLIEPALPFVVFVSLFTTFLSFMYLDESESRPR